MNELGKGLKFMKKKRGLGRDEIVGTARILTDFHSKHLDNYRNIIIWLPPGYNKLRNVQKKYPVLYMHDGQNLIDPKTSFTDTDHLFRNHCILQAGLLCCKYQQQ